MNDQQCVPGVYKAAAMSGESPTVGAPTKGRHSPSTPLLAGYNSRRWWRSSSTTAWCSAVDHSDVDRISRGMPAHFRGLAYTGTVFFLQWSKIQPLRFLPLPPPILPPSLLFSSVPFPCPSLFPFDVLSPLHQPMTLRLKSSSRV